MVCGPQPPRVYYCLMECTEFADLERSFVEVRRRRFQLGKDGDLTLELEDELSRAELKTLLALLDHCQEHGCRRTPARNAGATLPGPRKIGGIISPW